MKLFRLSATLLLAAASLVLMNPLWAEEEPMPERWKEWGCRQGEIILDCTPKVSGEVDQHLVIYYIPKVNTAKLAMWVLPETVPSSENPGAKKLVKTVVRYYRIADGELVFLERRDFEYAQGTGHPLFPVDSLFGQAWVRFIASLEPPYNSRTDIPPLSFVSSNK